jgi:hypothetical protein
MRIFDGYLQSFPDGHMIVQSVASKEMVRCLNRSTNPILVSVCLLREHTITGRCGDVPSNPLKITSRSYANQS